MAIANIMFKPDDSLAEKLSLIVLGIVFIGAGIMHFVSPDFYVAIMPPYLPAHLELVYLSGVAEIIGGIGVLVASWRRYAGYFLILVVLAVFPANIYMAQNPAQFPDLPAWALYVRLPLQFALIYWIYMTTK